ncbi:MAG: DUF6142 family protein [Lachnospiraceae bacterium]|nr:DUF6142 family protein [Lachnospiraceae bacterium]
MRAGYIFTNKSYSKKSIMSTVLGAIALVALLGDVYSAYRHAGEMIASQGAVCLLALIYAFLGLILAVLARMEKDRFYLFAYIGMALNLIDIFMVSAILYAGALL